MSSAVNVADGAIWMHEAVVRFKLDLLTDHPLHQFFQLGLVIRMNPLEQFFESRQTIPWIETLNAVAFLRPILDTGFRTPCPTPRLAEFLRICQIRFAAPQSFLSLLALGKINDKRYAPLAFLVQRSRAEQHRHPAAILAEILLLKRLQAPGQLELWHKLLKIAVEPFGWGQMRPRQAT